MRRQIRTRKVSLARPSRPSVFVFCHLPLPSAPEMDQKSASQPTFFIPIIPDGSQNFWGLPESIGCLALNTASESVLTVHREPKETMKGKPWDQCKIFFGWVNFSSTTRRRTTHEPCQHLLTRGPPTPDGEHFCPMMEFRQDLDYLGWWYVLGSQAGMDPIPRRVVSSSLKVGILIIMQQLSPWSEAKFMGIRSIHSVLQSSSALYSPYRIVNFHPLVWGFRNLLQPFGLDHRPVKTNFNKFEIYQLKIPDLSGLEVSPLFVPMKN